MENDMLKSVETFVRGQEGAVRDTFTIQNCLPGFLTERSFASVGMVTVILCLDGEVEISVDSQDCMLEADLLMVLLPSQVVRHRKSGRTFKCISVTVPQEFLDRYSYADKRMLLAALHIRRHPCVRLGQEERSSILDYCMLLARKRSSNHAFRQEIVGSILSAMFFELCEIYRHDMPPGKGRHYTRKEELFEKFIRAMDARERSVSYYARKFCLTPKHLSGVIKDVSGRTASEWIDDLVLSEARALLKNSAMSIQGISNRLNFPNQSFFSRYFRKYTHMSPSEYRMK